MNRYSFQIQNLKCGGCSSTITRKVETVEGVNSVVVDIDGSTVSFNGTEESADKTKVALDNLGYPLENKMNTTVKKAKSYVSCMVGRITN